jgi:glycosyltransferase 2 family protein
LSIHRVPFEFRTLQKYYFIAMFFNNFLPSTIGGDSYRVIKTMHNPRSRSSAVIAVLMERLTGLAALLLLGYLGAIVEYLRRAMMCPGWWWP